MTYLARLILLSSLVLLYPSPLSAQSSMLEVEQRLADLGYWLIKVDGKVDASTRHAIAAFQKVEGLKRTGAMNAAVEERLQIAVRPAAREPAAGKHVEVDISRQVLFLTDEAGVVIRVLPVSSGNEKPYYEKGQRQMAHTPRGRFTVTRQIRGVRQAPLGALYYPSYFYAGVAIHGSNSIPLYPASHGCVRVPRFADKELQAMLEIGTPVLVYD